MDEKQVTHIDAELITRMADHFLRRDRRCGSSCGSRVTRNSSTRVSEAGVTVRLPASVSVIDAASMVYKTAVSGPAHLFASCDILPLPRVE